MNSRLWADFTETARLVWTLEFIELAEQEIKDYDWIRDANSEYPWCTPWLVDEGEPITTPREYLDIVKTQIQDSIKEPITKIPAFTDEELVNAVYQWNLLFYDGAMKATKDSADIKKYKYLVKKEDVIKDTIYSYLTYWRKVNPTANPLVYVIDCTRNFMENCNPPKKKKDNTKYNKIPIQY